MSYQSILVHACQPELAQARYRLAAAIALAEDTRLTGIALSGAIEFIVRCSAAAAVAPIGPDDYNFLTDNAKRNLTDFENAVRAAGVVPYKSMLSDESAIHALPLEARYCDLLLIGQITHPDAILADAYSLARNILIHAPCPVMVVPSTTAVTNVPGRPLIAWDGSMEASRAVRAALPLLRRAGSVTAVCFHPQKYSGDEGQAGTRLATYLASHGIDVEVLAQAPASTGSIGDALLALVATRAHDLIVMGNFGHSRFRELVLGGVTETVLAGTVVPVLTSH
ncbi:nucleotide-binding universal stress UspA family protein [Massilia sp. MP_M2]|uniref:universal stress protein n=1 Tax=Massilia sp. MP_M2 TaxID=3071713 RepID=UPI00319DD394